jgi:hypothetical protein
MVSSEVKLKMRNWYGTIGSGVIGISFIIAAGAFIETLALPEAQRTTIITLFTWMKTSHLDVSLHIRLISYHY